MLGKQLKSLGRILIPLAIAGWGLFALVLGGQHLDDVPRELWLFGLVLAAAAAAAATAWLWLRVRRRDDSRW
jgi:hypothetical protein